MKAKNRNQKIRILFSALLILALSIFGIPFVSAVDFDEFKPYLHNPSVNDLPELETFGEFKTELFPGAGTYIYELEVPNGVNGLQPSLSLLYNSQSMLQRPGILGAGWVLSENVVTRHVNYTLDDMSDDYYILTLNNNRFKLIYNGSNFNTEIDPHRVRVENLSNSGDEYWLVTTGDGTQYRFGFNSDARLASNTGRIYDVKWSLDQVESVHGNKIFYAYREDPFSEDSGAVYLANITYNGDEKKLIEFNYEGQVRPDRRVVYEQGNVMEESRRLDDITVKFDGSLVRRYEFDYESLNSENSLSSLVNITYVGSDGSSVQNTITFEYYDALEGFDDSTGRWVVPSAFDFSSNDALGKDFGVRLLDVNNDGFPDLIKAEEGEAHKTQLNNKVNGWNDTSLFVVPSDIEIVNTNSVDQGVRFADINSDGLIDILRAKQGSTEKVYVNNGTGWTDESASWNIPVDFVDSSDKSLGVRLIDVNGDGRVDLVRAQAPSTKVTYLNNGTGWENVSDWQAPDYFVNSDQKDNGVRILDLNNDGLPDMVKGGKPGSAWFNNGTGWESHDEYAPDIEFTDHSGDRPDLGVRFMEVNGDGLVDMVQNFFSNLTIEEVNQTCVDQNGTNCTTTTYNVTFDSNIKLNNGSGWILGMDESPEEFTDEGFNIGRRIADINGDGFSDIVVGYQGPPAERLTHIKNATSAFLLKKVTNAYGGITDIVYKPSTTSDNGNELGFNIWVVDNTALNNSVGNGFEATGSYAYSYQNGKFDYSNKEFLGFGLVNETLPDSTVVAHFFHQDAILKGREFKSSIYDASGNHIMDEMNVFSHSSDNMIYLNQTSIQVYDGQATPVIYNTTFEYDFYGNVREQNKLGDTSIAGDERYEMFNYVYNTTNFVIDKPLNYTLFGADQTTIAKQVSYFYDNQTSGVRLGDVTKVVSFNDGGVDPEVHYTYDVFGNVLTQTEPLGHVTTYEYDETNTFRTKEINSLGHIVEFTYDEGFGNILSETRHGFNRTFVYDVFGRVTKEIIAPDTVSSPTKRYTYTLDGTAPEKIKVETRNSESDYTEQIVFYDGFGNLIQERTKFNANSQILSNMFYDSKFRIKEKQTPYLASYATDLSTPSNDTRTTYVYDSADRIINITKVDGNSILVVFNKTIVSQFDESGNRKDYVVNAHDEIINVVEYNGADTYNTLYAYRADGNLKNVTDAKGNFFFYEYDTLGRKTGFDDPNMNAWTYAYDANGNLINQTDGRGTTTFMTYDNINRLTLKSAGNTNVSFIYDTQYNGTLSKIITAADYYTSTEHVYTYDNRLRISDEDVFVCYRESATPECQWLNVSVTYDSADRILEMHMPQTTVNYSFNSFGKLESVEGFISSINYNQFGKVANKTYNNNLVTNIDYDDLGRISQLSTDNLQNVSYTYDDVSSVSFINDTKNSKAYKMEYDGLNRLTETIIFDFITDEHEKFTYVLDELGNWLSTTTDTEVTNFTYGSKAHAPDNITTSSRPAASLELNTVYPASDISVNQNQFFNYSTEICCRDNDCWGTEVYLDPQDEGFTSTTKTVCDGFRCNKIMYSSTKFVFEDEEWKNIRDARSLKGVWGVQIDLDERFPVEVIDYNYTTITLDVSTTDRLRLTSIPLTVYHKFDKTKKPTDKGGKVRDKDRSVRVGRNEKRMVTVDLSDTKENLLTQEIKWGDASTIITVYDIATTNLGDTHLRSGGYQNQNYGSNAWFEILNSSSSERKALIKFNTSSIPRQALIEDAQLNVWLDNNRLDNGESLNVSSYQIFHHFNWTEDTITWSTGPNASDYNNTATDEEYLFGGSGEPNQEFIQWDVTSVIKQKNDNESFLLIANIDGGAEGGDQISFTSKENFDDDEHPFLNVTYLLKGIIPMNSSETPFYTNVTNPFHVDLEQDQCQEVVWWVNATGSQRDYLFFAFANKTANGTVYAESALVTVTII